jgi:acyl-CoA synthetase (AMP-forming)/AMP-acid ligase II
MTGYWGRPDATAAVMTDGWFHTGDRGYLDDDGYLHLVARIKELINRGSEKISPREIDDVLLAHPPSRKPSASACRTARGAKRSPPRSSSGRP